MTFTATFRYAVKPDRMNDFMAILSRAASPEFDSTVMPSAVRLMKRTDTDDNELLLMIDYADEASYLARTSYERSNAAWQELFFSADDPPHELLSVELYQSMS